MSGVLLNKNRALRDAADYLVRIQEPHGFCVPIDSKHSEIAAYQVESVLVLLQAHDILGNVAYLEPAGKLMNAIVEHQTPDGRRFGSGTPASILLSWWATGRFGP